MELNITLQFSSDSPHYILQVYNTTAIQTSENFKTTTSTLAKTIAFPRKSALRAYTLDNFPDYISPLVLDLVIGNL